MTMWSTYGQHNDDCLVTRCSPTVTRLEPNERKCSGEVRWTFIIRRILSELRQDAIADALKGEGARNKQHRSVAICGGVAIRPFPPNHPRDFEQLVRVCVLRGRSQQRQQPD